MKGRRRTDDWRMGGSEAIRLAGELERTGKWWAAADELAQGVAWVILRSRRRPFPIVAKLRTAEEAHALLSPTT